MNPTPWDTGAMAGKPEQEIVAEAAEEFERRAAADDPASFVSHARLNPMPDRDVSFTASAGLLRTQHQVSGAVSSTFRSTAAHSSSAREPTAKLMWSRPVCSESNVVLPTGRRPNSVPCGA
jgi:hypothetical protein